MDLWAYIRYAHTQRAGVGQNDEWDEFIEHRELPRVENELG